MKSFSKVFLVGRAGIEPATSCVSDKCSKPTELPTHCDIERYARIELVSPAWKAGIINRYTNTALWTYHRISGSLVRPIFGTCQFSLIISKTLLGVHLPTEKYIILTVDVTSGLATLILVVYGTTTDINAYLHDAL